MKRLAMIAVLVTLLSTPNVLANNQGLHWNVRQEESFHFSFNHIEEYSGLEIDNKSLEAEMYITIDDIPTIPGDVDDWADVEPWAASVFFENGTTFRIDSLLFSDYTLFQFLSSHSAVPIGNWDLLEGIYPFFIPLVGEGDLIAPINNATYFGGIASGEVAGVGEGEFTKIYYKIDGSLANLSLECDITNPFSYRFQMSLNRTDPPIIPTFTLEMLSLLGGIGIVMGAIVLVVYAKRRK